MTSKHENLQTLHDFFNKLNSRSDKPLSKITVANYVSKINKLSHIVTGKDWDASNISWLMNPSDVIKKIHEADVTGKKDLLSPVLRLLKNNNVQSDIITEYQKGLTAFKNEEYSGRKKNKATEENVERSMPLSEIEKKIRDYKPTSEAGLTYKLICALYFLNTLVPRNDLNIFKLVSSTKKSKDMNKDFNYITIDKNGMPQNIIMNKYKTDHTFGQKKYGITDYVSNLIREYITKTKKINGDFLFTNRSGEPYTKSMMGDSVRKATETILGKAMGVDLIRQIIITDYYKSGVKTIEEDENHADRFLHGVNVHREYLRTNLEESDSE